MSENYFDSSDSSAYLSGEYSFEERYKRHFNNAFWDLKKERENLGLSSADQIKDWLYNYIAKELLPVYRQANKQLVNRLIGQLSTTELLESSYQSFWIEAPSYRLRLGGLTADLQPINAQLYIADADKRKIVEQQLKKLGNYLPFQADEQDIPQRIKQLYLNAPYCAQIDMYNKSIEPQLLIDEQAKGVNQVAWRMYNRPDIYANNAGIEDPEVFSDNPVFDDFYFGFNDWDNSDTEKSLTVVLRNTSNWLARGEYALNWATAANFCRIEAPLARPDYKDLGEKVLYLPLFKELEL